MIIVDLRGRVGISFLFQKKESDSMFDQLFFRSHALSRHLSAPLVGERCQYLDQCAKQGMATSTLRDKARILLSIMKYLRLADRLNDPISLLEINKAASRWSHHNWSSAKSSRAKLARKQFIAEAAGWLRLVNRLQAVPKPTTLYDQALADFRRFMEEDRGLAPTTVKYRCNSVRPFLDRLLDGQRSLKTITVSDIDSLFV
jgi:hypothetical protein